MFGDQIQQGDGVSIGLACGFCGAVPESNHECEEMKKWKSEQMNSETSSTLEAVSK